VFPFYLNKLISRVQCCSHIFNLGIEHRDIGFVMNGVIHECRSFNFTIHRVAVHASLNQGAIQQVGLAEIITATRNVILVSCIQCYSSV